MNWFKKDTFFQRILRPIQTSWAQSQAAWFHHRPSRTLFKGYHKTATSAKSICADWRLRSRLFLLCADFVPIMQQIVSLYNIQYISYVCNQNFRAIRELNMITHFCLALYISFYDHWGSRNYVRLNQSKLCFSSTLDLLYIYLTSTGNIGGNLWPFSFTVKS